MSPTLARFLFRGLASCIAAVLLQSRNERPLGDAPVAMFVFMLALALAGGLRGERPRWCGVAAALGFPVAAIVDMAAGREHSLWPLEFLFYAGYALAAVGMAHVGAALGARLRRPRASRA